MWKLGPSTGSGEIPYDRQIRWSSDPQKLWNVIYIFPFSPDGAQLNLITPASASSVQASIRQYGPEPLQVTSWQQDTTKMQSQANWLFTNFGHLHVRVDNITIDAGENQAWWPLIAGINIGDVISVQMWQVGGGGNTQTFRTTRIRRRISYGGQDGTLTASVMIESQYEPSSYWT